MNLRPRKDQLLGWGCLAVALSLEHVGLAALVYLIGATLLTPENPDYR